MAKTRDTNIELLRIIAMFFVLVLHANFTSLGIPTKASLLCAPIREGFRILLESFSIVAVNVYVLLSGWYGIHFKFTRLCEFVFQVFFFSLIGAAFALLFQGQSLMVILQKGILLMDNDSYWFVKSYLLLYIVSPILESYITITKERDFGVLIALFFLFEFVYGFGKGCTWFSGGYSTIHFIGLYLLARYTRLFLINRRYISSRFAFLSYLLLSVITAVLFVLSMFLIRADGWGAVFSYESPLVILSAIMLVISFAKIKINSPTINAIAISCFAVYLLHNNPFIFDYYICQVQYLVGHGISFLLPLFLLLVFTVSIVLDKCRISLWQIIQSKLICTKTK